VRGDDRLGGSLATSHLIGLGHRRIAFLGGLPNTSTSIERRQGFVDAHLRADIPTRDELILSDSYGGQAGYRMATQVLSLPEPPTAIFAVNDAVAIGASAAIRDVGLSVPDDIAVVGYNDSPISAMLPTPLTSVRIPLTDMGTLAVDVLIAMLNGEHYESHVLEPNLVVRESSGARSLNPRQRQQ
jgi:LacI family transcriptional regulator